MKNKMALGILIITGALLLGGCTEADQVSYNVSKEANNFNVTRRLTVLNARTDSVMLEMEGTFSLANNAENELEVICEVGDGVTKSIWCT